ncbi:MAG: cytochrome C oxidase subunit IV family protein [Thermoanaerobaculia bacterium]|nr:cytochrome C oxidase subunit IV family protein [Thermoanaerobaculia bacterium]
MSRTHSDVPSHSESGVPHHIVGPATYIAVICTLFGLTALTVWVAFHHLGDPWNDVVAISIAVTKASLVVLFFMHAKWGESTTKLAVLIAIFFLLLLLLITFSDFATRGWLGVPGS